MPLNAIWPGPGRCRGSRARHETRWLPSPKVAIVDPHPERTSF